VRRSNSLDPEDFRALHESIIHALEFTRHQYYRFRGRQADGGYLQNWLELARKSCVKYRIIQRFTRL